MYAQFFGNYLLSRDAITKEQLIFAMQKKSSEHMRLGTLAIHAGYMTADEIDRIIIMQTHEDKRFGELTIREGYLTEEQVAELLKDQNPDFLLLGQVLVDEGIFNNQQLQNYIIDYQSENELYEFDYSDETRETIDHLVKSFFVVSERSLSNFELSYLHLLFNNLIRFIGDDFSPVCPYLCKEYPTNYCVSQKIDGDFSIKVYIDMPEKVCIDFASRYVHELFTEVDEYVQSSLEDFINLHNGLFNVNISNDYSVELQLDPPIVESEELLSLTAETYVLPIVYSFGTIHFIFEVFKNA